MHEAVAGSDVAMDDAKVAEILHACGHARGMHVGSAQGEDQGGGERSDSQ